MDNIVASSIESKGMEHLTLILVADSNRLCFLWTKMIQTYPESDSGAGNDGRADSKPRPKR